MPSDPDSILILTLICAFACLVLSSFYAAGGAAVDFLSEAQIKREAQEGDPTAKRLLKLISWQKAVISPLQAGLSFFGLLGLCFALCSFGRMMERSLSPVASETLRALLAGLIVTACYLLVFFIFGDLLPKKSVRHNAKSFASRFAGLLCVLQGLAFPFLKLCALIVNGILRLCRIDPHVLDDPVTEEEILQMVGEGEEKGVIEESEKDMIANILDFKDTTAGETMTHRTDIVAVDPLMRLQKMQ